MSHPGYAFAGSDDDIRNFNRDWDVAELHGATVRLLANGRLPPTLDGSQRATPDELGALTPEIRVLHFVVWQRLPYALTLTWNGPWRR